MTEITVLNAAVLALAVLAIGCGSDSLRCGEGTANVDGQCIPAEPQPGGGCGPGTVKKGSKCIPDPSLPPPKSCGEGTVEASGVCVLASAYSAGACGEGTIEVNGHCIPTPGEPLSVGAVSLTHLKFDKQDGETIHVLHSVHVSVGVTATHTEPFDVVVFVGLRDTSDDSQCELGGFRIHHAGDGEEERLDKSFEVPEACLEDDEGNVLTQRAVYPVVTIDPLDSLDEENAADYEGGVVFSPANVQDPIVAQCNANTEAEGSAQSCTSTFTVAPSPGVDVAILQGKTVSSVGLLRTCEGDGDVPAEAEQLCQSLLVDEKGQLRAELPLLKLTTSLKTYGVPHSDAFNGDASSDGGTFVTVTHWIRPLGLPDAGWLPLYVRHDGGVYAEASQIPTLTGSGTFSLAVELYAGPLKTGAGDQKADSHENKGATARTAITTGAWKDETDFVVQTRVESADEHESFQGGPNGSTETQIKIVKQNLTPIVLKTLQLAAKEVGQTKPTGKHTFKMVDFHDNMGDPELASMDLRVTSAITATADYLNWTSVARADFVGVFSKSLARAWVDVSLFTKGHANGNGKYDIGLTVFGDKKWGISDQADLFWFQDHNYSKKADNSFKFPMGIYSVGIRIAASGAVGVTFNAEAYAVAGQGNAASVCDDDSKTAPVCKDAFKDALSIGVISALVQPYAFADVTVEATLTILDLGIISGLVIGGGAKIDVVNLQMPFVARLLFGITQQTAEFPTHLKLLFDSHLRFVGKFFYGKAWIGLGVACWTGLGCGSSYSEACCLIREQYEEAWEGFKVDKELWNLKSVCPNKDCLIDIK